jgi:hypothetical protein
MMARAPMEKRSRNPLRKVNWKDVRNDLLSKSVPVPAPVFFLIFFAISWACFTLYFKVERSTRAIEELQHRTHVLENQMQTYDSPSDIPPEEEDEVEISPQILEM